MADLQQPQGPQGTDPQGVPGPANPMLLSNSEHRHLLAQQIESLNARLLTPEQVQEIAAEAATVAINSAVATFESRLDRYNRDLRENIASIAVSSIRDYLDERLQALPQAFQSSQALPQAFQSSQALPQASENPTAAPVTANPPEIPPANPLAQPTQAFPFPFQGPLGREISKRACQVAKEQRLKGAENFEQWKQALNIVFRSIQYPKFTKSLETVLQLPDY